MRIAGLPVEDARKPLTLHITKDDCAKGDTKDPAMCAAARAAKRALAAKEVRVHIGRTYVKLADKWVRFATSKALRTEIIAFDRGGAFEPGEYVLKPMISSLKLGTKRGWKPKTGKGKRLKYHNVTGVRQKGANR